MENLRKCQGKSLPRSAQSQSHLVSMFFKGKSMWSHSKLSFGLPSLRAGPQFQNQKHEINTELQMWDVRCGMWDLPFLPGIHYPTSHIADLTSSLNLFRISIFGFRIYTIDLQQYRGGKFFSPCHGWGQGRCQGSELPLPRSAKLLTRREKRCPG